MLFRDIELNGHGSLLLTRAHQAGICPRAQRETQRIQQDGFAGARFTRQYAQPRIAIQLQAVNQHNVLNGQA